MLLQWKEKDIESNRIVNEREMQLVMEECREEIERMRFSYSRNLKVELMEAGREERRKAKKEVSEQYEFKIQQMVGEYEERVKMVKDEMAAVKAEANKNAGIIIGLVLFE
jgi:hypothetical protein